MATYRPRPDGLADVMLDDGRTIPMALAPDQLEAAGVQLYQDPGVAAPPTMASQASAGGPVNVDPFGLGAGQPVQPLPASAVPSLMSQQAPQQSAQQVPPQAPPATPTRAPTAAEESRQMSFAPPPGQLVSSAPQAQGEGAGAAGGAAGPTDDELIRDVMNYRSGGDGSPQPAGFQPTNMQVRRQGDIDPQLAQQLDAERQGAEADTTFAAIGKSDVAKGQALERLHLATDEANQAQAEHEAAIERRNRIQSAYDSQVRVIDNRLAELEGMRLRGSARERVMQDKSAFTRVLATIGGIIGEFKPIKNMFSGKNLVEEALNKEVNDEVEREKSLVDEVGQERSTLKQMLESGMSPIAAEDAARLLKKSELEAQVKEWAARSDYAMADPNLQEWIAQSDEQRAKEKEALQQKIAGDVVQSFKFKPASGSGGGGPRDPLKDLERGAKARVLLNTLHGGGASGTREEERKLERGAKERELYVPGEGYAFRAEEATQARKAKTAKDNMKGLIQEALEIRKNFGGGSAKDMARDVARLQTIRGQMVAEFKEQKELGALDNGVLRLADAALGDPSAFLSTDAVTANEKLRTVDRVIDQQWERYRRDRFTTDPRSTAPVNPPTPRSFQPR